jgi:dolichol-phosphate mannosyltransferase
VVSLKAVVVTPTYNEAENIERLIEVIQSLSKKSPYDLHQLIVDDKSPDHTGEMVRNLQKKYPKLHLITGNKEGLGKAYIHGFKYAMKELGADVLMEFDADFSHPPEVIPVMLDKINEGYDLAIGSRYVPGGSVPNDWGRFRKFNSWVANFLGRFIAGLYKVHDVTAGFRAIRVKGVADQVDWEKSHAQGYSFQLMNTYYLLQHTDKVVEVPIHFVDRKLGTSKVGANATYIRDILEFIKNAWYIRAKKTEVLIKFLIVGGSGVFVNLFIYGALLTIFLNMSLQTANAIAVEVSILTNFLLNNAWTFGHRDIHKSFVRRLVEYNVTAGVGGLVQIGIVAAMVYLFGDHKDLNYPIVGFHKNYIYPVAGIAIATIWNFAVANFWIFRERK